MSKEMKDSWWDSKPVFIVFAIANAWFLSAWLFGWTVFGQFAKAASAGWHGIAIACTLAFWVLTYLIVKDKVEGSKGLVIAAWILLFVFIPLALCGFKFS